MRRFRGEGQWWNFGVNERKEEEEDDRKGRGKFEREKGNESNKETSNYVENINQ